MMEELKLSSAAKQEKLVGHSNWPIWLMIAKSMLMQKDIWDLIEKKPRLAQENLAL